MDDQSSLAVNQTGPSETPDAKGSNNSNLMAAKKAKNDEFYTRIEDIQAEVKHYASHFEGKTVFCNCDDPEWSNFWIFFRDYFDQLKLKRLVATYYTKNGQSAGQLVCHDQHRDKNGNVVKLEYPLQGDGDFRSPECVNLLREADIVCTNPPFSLFREYIALLMEHQKKFLVIGDMNAITYKEIFPLIQTNRVWLGATSPKRFFTTKAADEYQQFGNKCWYTNLEHARRNEAITLVRSVSDKGVSYPTYDNYDAINVAKTQDIPYDHEGAMGVPISFLNRYNPDQFEILGIDRYIKGNKTPNKRFTIEGSEVYARIVIKRKQ